MGWGESCSTMAWLAWAGAEDLARASGNVAVAASRWAMFKAAPERAAKARDERERSERRGDMVLAAMHVDDAKAMMEAMAAAVPCVTTATGSNHELIDASCGLLVPQRDSAAIANALEALIADPERRRELGRAARTRVIKLFDTKRTTSELLWLIAAAG